MTVTASNARHVLLRLGESARLPDALLGALRDEVVVAGWMRGSGVLHDVRIGLLGGGSPRTVKGPVHVISLEGSIGLAQGDVSCGLRAVLARETETGLETIAGEIVDARVGALEVMVTAFDEVTATRQAGHAGVWLLDASGPQRVAPVAVYTPPAQAAAPAPAPAPAPAAPAVAAQPPPAAPSEPAVPKPQPPKPSPTFSAPAAMPIRPVKPQVEEEEQVYPDAGDVVEHFAFGRCEVVKSDGDRLHLRLGKDGRIKEIALEMLKVTPLTPVEGAAGRHFKLDRKL
jgi:predicted DNA-binding protein with PD1-like motif